MNLGLIDSTGFGFPENLLGGIKTEDILRREDIKCKCGHTHNQVALLKKYIVVSFNCFACKKKIIFNYK